MLIMKSNKLALIKEKTNDAVCSFYISTVNKVKQIREDDDGIEFIEWMFLLGVVVVIIIAVFFVFRPQIMTLINKIFNNMNNNTNSP